MSPRYTPKTTVKSYPEFKKIIEPMMNDKTYD